MKKKSIVLLSGGLDSSVNLYWALRETEILKVLTFNYGQRAAEKEIAAASWLCREHNLNHQVIDLTWFREFTRTSLVDREMNVPVGEQIQPEDLSTSKESATAVWVPNRNGIFLNVAAGFAEGLGADMVVPGFNAEEAVTFADNSKAFCKALEKSFSFSTEKGIDVECHTIDLDKKEIVALAMELGLPLGRLWPCYLAEEQLCGRCESCQRFYLALEGNGLKPENLGDLL